MIPKVGYVYLRSPQTPPNVIEHISEISKALQVLGLEETNVFERPLMPLLRESRAPRHWVLHNSVTYSPHTLRQLLSSILLSHRDPVVHILKQDEHLAPSVFDSLFTQFPVSTVFSYLPPGEVPIVYPRSVEKGIRFRKTFVAYVTSELGSQVSKPLPPSYSASYRGSLQPVSLGLLGQDKAEIPMRAMRALPAGSRWKLDVSSEEDKRLYGQEWFNLLERSYAVMSSESGSNCFDLDGSLASATAEFQKLYGRITYLDSERYELYYESVLSAYEGNVRGGTFAPRNLEAAVMGRPQILIDGGYEGLFEDGETALFVRRDFSNFAEVLEILKDRDFSARLAASAREAILGNAQLRISSLTDLILESVAFHDPPRYTLPVGKTVENPKVENSTRLFPAHLRLFRIPFVFYLCALLTVRRLARYLPASFRTSLQRFMKLFA